MKTRAEIDAWYQEYLKRERESLERAIKEGCVEAERSFFADQLIERFGKLPAATTSRLDAADSSELRRWSKRLFAAQTLADIFENVQ